MKSQRKEVFSVWVLLWKEKFSLAAISAVVLSALFVVNLDEIDGGRGSTRCYTYAKSGSGIEFSEDSLRFIRFYTVSLESFSR